MTSLQKKEGKAKAAMRAREQWLDNNPEDTPVRLAYAQDLHDQGVTEQSQRQYRAVLETDPKNIVALNNLAWSLKDSEPEEALNYIRTANKEYPGQPSVLDTLAVVEHANGNHRRVLAVIEQGLKLYPQSLTMQYHRALILSALDRNEQAIKSLQELVAKDPQSFSKHAEAQALLERLGG